LLYMTGKMVWGPLKEPAGHGVGHGHDAHRHDSHGKDAQGLGVLPPDLNRREILTLVPLAALCVFLGVYPAPVIKALEAPVAQTVLYIETARAKGPVAPPTIAGGAPKLIPAKAAVHSESIVSPATLVEAPK